MKNKKCKFCQSEIDVNAKKCPKCQADLRSWFARHPIMTVVVVFVAVPFIIGPILRSSHSLTGGSNTVTQSKNSIEPISVETKVTEKNSVWWKYSWVLTLKNNGERDVTISPILKWVDKDRFVLDRDTQHNLTIPAGKETTFNGYKLIDASVAPSVDGIEVESR